MSISENTDFMIIDNAGPDIILSAPELSDWKCYLFGGNDNGIVWRPYEGTVPCRFWRLMQYLCLGNRWVKA